MRTMQNVSQDELEAESWKSGQLIEFDHAQGIAYCDVSPTLTLFAYFDVEAS